MKVATMGLVSKTDEYIGKKDGLLVRTLYVASGEHMIKCPLEDDQHFEDGDMVTVAGELGTFDRRVFVTGAKVRLASAEDRLFFMFRQPEKLAASAEQVIATQQEAAAAAAASAKKS